MVHFISLWPHNLTLVTSIDINLNHSLLKFYLNTAQDPLSLLILINQNFWRNLQSMLSFCQRMYSRQSLIRRPKISAPFLHFCILKWSLRNGQFRMDIFAFWLSSFGLEEAMKKLSVLEKLWEVKEAFFSYFARCFMKALLVILYQNPANTFATEKSLFWSNTCSVKSGHNNAIKRFYLCFVVNDF